MDTAPLSLNETVLFRAHEMVLHFFVAAQIQPTLESAHSILATALHKQLCWGTFYL